jgi:lysophospholipase L1-like esterase
MADNIITAYLHGRDTVSVRCSHCHLILDPVTDINDNIHPNAGGYNKMALAILSQINAWQNT